MKTPLDVVFLALVVCAVACRAPEPSWDAYRPDRSLAETSVASEVGLDTGADAAPDRVIADITPDFTDAVVADVTDADAPPVDQPQGGACPPGRCDRSCCPGPCTGTTCETLVGAAGNHTATCAWSESGRAWCWGTRDDTGRSFFTNITDDNLLAPRPRTDFSDVREMALNLFETCAITRAGALDCASAEPDDPGRPERQVNSGARSVAAAGAHTCVLLDDGRVRCRFTLGRNGADRGQLGRGTLDGGASPDAFDFVRDPSGPLTGVTAIAAGETHTCALKADGVWCWGSNAYGQLGSLPRAGSPRCADGPCDPWPQRVTGLSGTITAITAGTFHTCARSAAGALWCWGRNGERALGPVTGALVCPPDAGLQDGCAVPQQANVSDVQQVTAGDGWTCVARGPATGATEVRCWGRGYEAASGSVIDGAAPLRTLIHGTNHACVITQAGALRCWGDGGSGQIADGRGYSPTAAPVSGLTAGSVALGLGESHTCAALDGGQARCWGLNEATQLGARSSERAIGAPSVVQLGAGVPLTNVTQLAAGDSHTCARRGDGTLVCWGSAYSGQLGPGLAPLSPASDPRVVPGLTGALSVHAGEFFTCARSDGGVECWGENRACETTRGFDAGACSPEQHAETQTVPLAGVVPVNVATGQSHTCAWGSDGRVSCWGDNDMGQANGHPRTVDRVPPTILDAGLGAVMDMGAGSDITCAVLTSGAVWCWGDNTRGALGRELLDPRTPAGAPAPVVGVTDALKVRVGYQFACALVRSGRVFCWGRNDYGQLGAGFPTHRHQPAAVMRDGGELQNVVELAVGGDHACARLNDGAVLCWGSDVRGQLGRGHGPWRAASTPIVW